MKKMTCEKFIEKMNSVAVMYVKFTKQDGNEREMMCTRNPLVIPEDKISKRIERTPTSAATAVPVFDLEIKEWRSIKPESILEMKTIFEKEDVV